VPTGLKFSQYVTQAASNQYAVKNNSAEYEVVNGAPLALGAFVNGADPTTYYRYSGSLTTPGVRRMRCVAACRAVCRNACAAARSVMLC
jgi:carbonic anhydrase